MHLSVMLTGLRTPRTSQIVHADLCSPPKAFTIGIRASEVNHRAKKEGGLVWWIPNYALYCTVCVCCLPGEEMDGERQVRKGNVMLWVMFGDISGSLTWCSYGKPDVKSKCRPYHKMHNKITSENFKKRLNFNTQRIHKSSVTKINLYKSDVKAKVYRKKGYNIITCSRMNSEVYSLCNKLHCHYNHTHSLQHTEMPSHPGSTWCICKSTKKFIKMKKKKNEKER